MARQERLGGAFFLALLAAGCASAPTTPEEPTLEDKLARLLKLEDERSSGGGEVEARLSDAAGRVRARAALVLARSNRPGAAARIAPLLDDPVAHVRATAAFSLGLLEAELEDDVLFRLRQAAGDDNETVRARVLEALGKKSGVDAAELIATTLSTSIPRGAEPYEWTDGLETSALSYPHHDVRLGLFALVRLDSLRWSWDILATEGQTPRFVWWPAAWAVSELDGDERAPLIAYYAGSPDPGFRFWGARGLRTLGDNESRERARTMLSDPNERVRIAAIRAAAARGLHEVVPDLLALLDRDTRYVQVEILKALSRLNAPAAVDALLDQLGSDSYWVRSLALPALAKQDPDGFLLVLAGLGADRSWQVRASLADLLGRLGGEQRVQLLRTSLDPAVESDARVRASALTALASADPEEAPPILIRHLTAEDPFERLAAARAIATTGARDAAAPVKQAFLVEASDEPRVRAGLLEALAALDPESATATAREALDDSSYLVRRAAAAILQRSGEADVTVLARPSDQDLEAYRPYVSPPYTPQAYLRTERGVIEIELFVLDAPLTVRNFIQLSREGFYNGLAVHRVLPNGYVQAGDPRGDGNGGPGYDIRSEINERPFVRGSVAMVDHGPDTAGSQFFITHLPFPDLDGRHTVFGQVKSGMEVLDRTEPGDTLVEVTVWDGLTSPYRD